MYQEEHVNHCYPQIWNEFYCLLLLNLPLPYIVKEVIARNGKKHRSKTWIIMEILICCSAFMLCLWFDLYDLISERVIWVMGIAVYTVIMFEILYFMMTRSKSNSYRTLLSTKIMITILTVSTIFHVFINSWSYYSYLQSIQYSIPMVYIIIEPYIFADQGVDSKNIASSSDCEFSVSLV